MPRVAVNRMRYKEQDLAKWIIGRMAEQKKTNKHMGDLLGITRQAFGQRLRGGERCELSAIELVKVFEDLGAEPDDVIRLLTFKRKERSA